MSLHLAACCPPPCRRFFSRSSLLVTVSAVALLAANPAAIARSLGGKSPSPSAAAIAAGQAAQLEASRAARQAQNALKRATLAIQAMQASQQAARDAARAQLNAMPNLVPNGLGAGGLQIGTGVVGPGGAINSDLWQGAKLPSQTTEGGRTKVGIEQTKQKAILTWDTFNVGGKTDLVFDQKGNRNWVALNRVLGTDGRPSQILGSIKGDGSVYVINQSGIIFGGTSQVNVGALIASTANITDQQFLSGIYSAQGGTATNPTWTPSFTDAAALLGNGKGGGVVRVEAGAQITTKAPASVTSGGGFVLLMGGEVVNAGSITTRNGQTQLAAGDDFVLRRGYGTDVNKSSTTRGTEIATLLDAGSSAGLVRNTGLITSAEGDITLAGRTLQQDGILIASTSVDTRGTIHLLNAATDTAGSITLGAGSLTAILPELDSKETALNSQRDALIAASAAANRQRGQSATGVFNNLSLLADRLDQSRIEIVTGGTVVFKGGATPEVGSLTMAQGGQVAVSAGRRIFTESGATIDVSGVRDVSLAMSSNNILVNIQGNELRDSPQNRDNDYLKNQDVWVDLRDLIYVPAGTGGYDSDRYYTPGGLLEVGGYLANTAHSIGEWSAVGGTITLGAPEVIAQKGSIFDISGGSVAYQGGYIKTANFLGRDGRLTNINRARANMTFYGVGHGFIRKSERWGVTEVWMNPFGKGRFTSRWEDGYIVGRDAGRLNLSAPTAVFEGDIVADVVKGSRQLNARPDGITDGYNAGQNIVARAGTLGLGQYGTFGRTDAYATDVVIGDVAGITSGADAAASFADRTGTFWLDAEHLNVQGLGGIDVATRDSITIESDLTLAHGGRLDLVAPIVDINADITTRGGSVSVSNIFKSDAPPSTPIELTLGGTAQLRLHGGATIDVRGQWTNGLVNASDLSGLAHVDGGNVTFASTQNVTIASGSAIDVSSGAAILANGKTKGGKGGDIAVEANVYTGSSSALSGKLVLDGELRGYGVDGGGNLSIGGSPMLIADYAAAVEPGQLLLKPDFFKKGFSQYNIKGNLLNHGGVTVADGTELSVEMPVYRFTATAYATPTGVDSASALEVWTPPIHILNAATGTFTQRKGASLAFVDVGDVSIGTGSRIEVDPGQSIAISSLGQITIDGRLNAFGGTIAVISSGVVTGVVPGRSIWIGDNAVLDAAARAVAALDHRGRSFAHVTNGGTIKIGVDNLTPKSNGLLDSISQAFVIIRRGAILDASGARATIDLAAGGNAFTGSDVRTLSSNGGSISLASSTGLVLDGKMRAAAGGAGAAGGSLNLILESGAYVPADIDEVKQPRILTVTQARQSSHLPTDIEPGEHHASLDYARARLSVEQVQAGGFDNLSLWSADIIRFEGDVSLNLKQNLTLQRGVISVADTTPEAQISLSAPVVRFDGAVRREVSSFGMIRPFLRNTGGGSWQPATENAGRLTVKADLIDIGDWVRFGASDVYDFAYAPGSNDQTITAPIEAPGFSDIHFLSRSDIRFRTGSLATAGDLTLTAAQLYPVTGASATILAGATMDGSALKPDPESILGIRSNRKSAQPPWSVFGALGLIAGIIEQDGVLRAPLGSILLGRSAGDQGFYDYQNGGRVILRESSITSVSAAGLVIPYGGTVDGLKYNYNGRELTLPDLMALDAMGKIEINSDKFEAEPGAVLDLSGGGELAGAGFIAGRSGSVDILRTPLVNANPAFGFSAASNKVYAILPGFASDYAPLMQEKGAGDSAVGQQITIPSGVPGLPAGTYTLLPSTYAMLPGAYRVEIGGNLPRGVGPTAVGNGSYVAGAYLGIANTPIRSALQNQIVVTPGKTARTHSQYNETSFSSFALGQAARFGTTRARLPIDGKQLVLTFEEAGDVLDFNGTALFAPGKGGYAGTLLVQGYQPIEIKASGTSATDGMTALNAVDLSRFDAGTLFVGGSYSYGGGGAVYLRTNIYSGGTIAVRSGAVLEAGQILLAGNDVSVEDGAVLDTTRSAFAVPDSTLGYVFANGNSPDDVNFGSVLVVANGWLNLLPAVVPIDGRTSRLTVANGAILRTRGTIGFVAADQLSLGQAQLNARYLALSLPAVNVGTEASLAAAEAAGVLGTGWNLTQTTLDRLLNPATTNLAALERLSLSVRDAINFYGNVTLDVRNQAGGSAETMVVLNTPAIYGWGDGTTSAVLAADTLVWSGVATGDGTVEKPYTSLKPPAVHPSGAGTGSGHLTFTAREFHFGYDPLARKQNSAELERLALGFSGVDLIASEKVNANNRGIVSFYESGTDAASYTGGNLAITTPLFTADSGAMVDFRAGGAITVKAAGQTTDPSAHKDLGGEIRLKGSAITLDTTVALPSGRLIMRSQGNIMLGPRALVDLAGRAVSFYDVTKYSWGGTLEMESRVGRIAQAAGSVIDVSARNNDAGSVKASAMNGTATFAGTLRGETSGGHAAGSFSLSANTIADFASLNGKLNASSFFGERSFTAKSGDLVVGNEVKARVVNISADGGSLIVNGRIDASGEKVGTIRLSARDDLTLASSAVLDVHGTVLQTDSHGAAIEASNRGSIELTTKSGVVTLADGATIDMRSADGVARGKLEINAPRVGNDSIAINAANHINIRGAASIAVNGFRSYTPSDGVINQAYLDGIHGDSEAFVNAAIMNGALEAQLAGLKAYGSAFHLRSGVEITSDGDLVTSGDLDLSGYRYGPAADASLRGSGEPGVLVVRAGGNFKINGSINDGFAPPPPTQDDYNWADGREGKVWAVSPMLAPGSLSWSMRFISGADLAASDTRAVKSVHTLGDGGDLVLDDPHRGGDWLLQAVSVVRTGTGYLDLIAGGDYRHNSLFGVYTAGTALPETQNYTGFWLTEDGGDVRVEAGGTLAGYSYMSDLHTNQRKINEWLRVQDGAWGINFGAYIPDAWGLNELTGFAGIGALGGGNVNIASGGDAGVMSPQLLEFNPDIGLFESKASGLDVAIGGSGYLDANGVLRQTGGGDLTMKIGGRLNTAPLYQSNNPGGGTLVNVRGDISVTASAIGLVGAIGYGRPFGYTDPRPIDPTRPYDFRPDGGLMLALGDSRATINTLGDLVILHASDPGAADPAGVRFLLPSISETSVSLWTDRTAIDLFSAGGSVAPITSYDMEGGTQNDYYSYSFSDRPYPPALGVVAAGGNVLVFGQADLMRSPNARLDLLARDSIHYGYNAAAEGNYLTIWGDDLGGGSTSNPMRFYAVSGDITNIRTGHILSPQWDQPETLYIGGGPVRIRAGRDVIAGGGLDDPNSDWANEGGAGGLIVHSRDDDLSIIEAGRDIIYANFQVGGPGQLALTAGRHIYQADNGSVVSIGAVAPGDPRPGASIAMTAGAGASGPSYVGLLSYLDPANLAVVGTPLIDQPGKVAKTYEKELTAWLKERYGYEAADDAEARAYFVGLASEQQNVFLRSLYFAELREGGREYNDPESSRFGNYVRGRNVIAALFPDKDANGNAITYAGDITMFSTEKLVQEYNPLTGQFEMVRKAHDGSVRTLFGGDIQFLAPGGNIVVGVEGVVPGSTAGVVSQGRGSIGLYSKGSILLGLSRIMTTFGGDILAWSAEGDINAGRGSKTTIVYAPPRRVYDDYGHVAVSPGVPSSGAGISARSSIADIPSGNVDLIAPLGTVDVGEAGISGLNVNIAALHIVNAANISAQGNVTGVPTIQAPNIGGLTEASNTAGSAAQQAAAPQQRANEQPSVIIVEIVGYGGGDGTSPQSDPSNDDRQKESQRQEYDPNGAFRAIGNGNLTEEQRSQLTERERANLDKLVERREEQ